MTSLTNCGQAFLSHCRISKGLSEHSLRAYQQDFAEFEFYVRPNTFEESICRETISGYLDYLRAPRNLQARTIKRRIAFLKSFFKWLEREEFIETSPFHKMDISIRLPKQLPRSLTRTEMSQLEKQARPRLTEFFPEDSRKSHHLNPLDIHRTTHFAILLMAATGIRVGELINISLTDIDLNAGAIRIYGKGSRERTVFVTNEILLQMLQKLIIGHARTLTKSCKLFLNRSGEALSTQALRLRIKKIAQDAKIERNVTPHMLRHTAATSLVEAGVDIRYVQKLLGHQSISTTELYTHVSDQSLKKAIGAADTIGRFVR